MYSYLKKKILAILPILLGVSFITFALLHIAPGDPLELKLAAQGISMSEEVTQQMRVEMGLDKPMIMQYGLWLLNLLQGDLGVSYSDHMPVWDKLLKAIPNTLLLTISALGLTLIISVPVGVYAAMHQNKWMDKLVMSLTFVGASIPNFFLSLVLIYVFALNLKVLPVLANGTIEGLILPTLALSIGLISRYIRQVRAAVIEALGKAYVQGLKSRGVKASVILYKNVLVNIGVHLITLIGLSMGSLLGGAAVVETIFVWRGLGKLVIDAISARDYPVVQGFVVVTALMYITINTMTDLIYKVIDPRVEFEKT